MFKFLIGPALVGGGYVAGSIYGADAEQLVHKTPSATYAAVENALAGVRESGMTSFDGGTPIPYELKIDRSLDQRLTLTLYFNGRQGAEANVTFVPRNDGKDTLMAAKVHSDHAVLRAALAGTNKAKLAYAPDWMLNLTFRSILQQLAQQIEQGGTASAATFGFDPGQQEAQWEANLTPEQRQQVADWQQYQASQPALDPDAAARNAAAGGNQ